MFRFSSQAKQDLDQAIEDSI
jgi:cytochrome c oxidase assembly protein subunit 11